MLVHAIIYCYHCNHLLTIPLCLNCLQNEKHTRAFYFADWEGLYMFINSTKTDQEASSAAEDNLAKWINDIAR